MSTALELSKDTISNSLSITDIRTMIAELSTTEDGEDLKEHMVRLKEALRHNPEACALMLPEDIGQCVHYLRKMTGQAITAAAVELAGKKKRVTKVYDPAVEKSIEDMLFDGK
jgi:hypothetical protein